MGSISNLKCIRLFPNLIDSRSLIDKHHHTLDIGRVVTSGKIIYLHFCLYPANSNDRETHMRVNYLSTPDIILSGVKCYALD